MSTDSGERCTEVKHPNLGIQLPDGNWVGWAEHLRRHGRTGRYVCWAFTCRYGAVLTDPHPGTEPVAERTPPVLRRRVVTRRSGPMRSGIFEPRTGGDTSPSATSDGAGLPLCVHKQAAPLG